MKKIIFIFVLFSIPVLAAINPLKNKSFSNSQNIFDKKSVAVINIQMSEEDAELMLNPLLIKERWKNFPFPVKLPSGEIVQPGELNTRFGKEEPNDEFKSFWREPWYYYIGFYFPCNMTFKNQFIDEKIENIGIALRGSGSRRLPKKSYKIDFNVFDDSKTFFGMKKIKLQAEWKDPSMIRSALCFEYLDEMKLPATRNRHALLYVNDKLMGLYVLADHEDNTFLGTRFGSKDGVYYQMRNPKFDKLAWLNPHRRKPVTFKIAPQADLRWKKDINLKNAGGTRPYEKSENYNQYGWNKLSNLIYLLEFEPEKSFESALENIFDVETFIRQMAIETLTGNGDNYRWQGNNYQIYFDPVLQKLVFFVRDLSNTLGIDETGRKVLVRRFENWDQRHPKKYITKGKITLPMDWAKRNINKWGSWHIPWTAKEEAVLGPLSSLTPFQKQLFLKNKKYKKWYQEYLKCQNQDKPLARRVLNVPRYRRLYNQYISDLIATTFNEETITKRAEKLYRLLEKQIKLIDEKAVHKLKIKKFEKALYKPKKFKKSKQLIWKHAGFYPKKRHTFRFGGFITYGIIPFVKKRVKTAKEQLDKKIFALNEIFFYEGKAVKLEIFNPGFNYESLKNLFITDDKSNLEKWELPDVELSARSFFMLDFANAPFNFIPGKTLFLVYENKIIDKIFVPKNLQDGFSYGRFIDWDGFEFPLLPTPLSKNIRGELPPRGSGLIINEFMASNKKTIENPSTGNYDDWIEIYNFGEKPVNLKGLHISDKLSIPARHKFTESIIVQPSEFVLVWASGDKNAGPLNTDFKLSSGGEEVVLTAEDGSTILDSFEYGEQEIDVSIGRFKDGEGSANNSSAFFEMMPTPGCSNIEPK